jgi:hypothetical protein
MKNRIYPYKYSGPLASEIMGFISFKREAGSVYTSSELVFKAFDRFCTLESNRYLTPQQLADAWVEPNTDKPKYDGGCCVRQLGQYLTELGHPNAFTVLSAGGRPPRMIFVQWKATNL